MRNARIRTQLAALFVVMQQLGQDADGGRVGGTDVL